MYKTNGIVAVRYAKGNFEDGEGFESPYKAKLLKEGSRATVVTYSKMTEIIKNTNIDYPILSPNGKSDDYYLRRNIKEE